MQISLSRRSAIRWVSFVLAAFLVLFIGFWQGKRQVDAYKTQLQYGYSRSLEELTATLSNICVHLEKGVYANTATQFSNLSAQLLKEAGAAKTALSMLPPAEQELTVVNRFLSQVGDYAMFLAGKSVTGQAPDAAARENLQALSAVAGSLSQTMEEVRLKYDEEGVWDVDLDPNLAGEGFGAQMSEVEQALTDYPTLVYDGPFSDHILEGESKLLKNAPEVDREQARQVVARALGVSFEQVRDDADEEGKMPCYGFATDRAVAAVSKAGGYLVYFRDYTEVETSIYSYDQAVKIAQEYLNGQGENRFEPSYYFADNGVCVINFVHKEGATLCYPDLVKIGVALDTGRVVFYEGRGYLMNHHTRTIATPKYSKAQAEAALSPNLTVERVQQAIVPTGGREERLCYEFLCKGEKEEELLVYIRAEDLQEQQILLLLKTDGGTLTK